MVRWALAAALLAVAGQAPGQMPVAVTAPGPHEAALQRCTSIARNEPAAAAPLAEFVLLDAGTPPSVRVRALACLGQARAALGDAAAASRAVDRIVGLLEQSPLLDTEAAYALGQAGGILQTIGQPQRAAVLYERSLVLTRKDGTPRAQVMALLNIAGLRAGGMDDPAGADAFFAQAIALAEANGLQSSYMYFNHGLNLMRLARDDEALSALETAARLGLSTKGQAGVRWRADSVRAEILLRRGDVAAAERLLLAALTAQRTLPDPQGEAASLRRASQLHVARSQFREGVSAARESLAKAQGGHFAEDEVQSMLQLEQALIAAGQPREAYDIAEARHRQETTATREETLRSLAGMQAELQNVSGTSKMQRLSYENQVQALTINRAQLLRNIALALLAVVLAFGAAFFWTLRRANRRLFDLSTTDPLTGLMNRRLGASRLSGLAGEDRRTADGADAAPRSVLMLIDVDRFKGVNDRHGHQTGDLVLVELAVRLKAACRAEDLLARWGGEEFLVACRQPDLAHAQAFAERLRRSVADAPFKLSDGTQLQVTLSIGFSALPLFPGREEADWHQAVALADRALYAIKRSGRNAWAGLWGAADDGTSLVAIERDPQDAAERGVILLASSTEVNWRPLEIAGAA